MTEGENSYQPEQAEKERPKVSLPGGVQRLVDFWDKTYPSIADIAPADGKNHQITTQHLMDRFGESSDYAPYKIVGLLDSPADLFSKYGDVKDVNQTHATNKDSEWVVTTTDTDPNLITYHNDDDQIAVRYRTSYKYMEKKDPVDGSWFGYYSTTKDPEREIQFTRTASGQDDNKKRQTFTIKESTMHGRTMIGDDEVPRRVSTYTVSAEDFDRKAIKFSYKREKIDSLAA